MSEVEDLKKKIEDLENRVKFFERIFLQEGNDVRIQNKVRSLVIVSEHTTGKPTVVGGKGKRYNLQTV